METLAIGIGISLFTQLAKLLTEKYGKEIGKIWTTVFVLVICIIAGLVAWLLKDNESLIRNIGEILGSATLFYNFVIKWIPALQTDKDLKGTEFQREEKLATNLDIDVK